MFTVIWDHLAFDQMHAIILWNPSRKTEFARGLKIAHRRLSEQAGTWGESREGPFRIAFVDDLTFFYSVDLEDEVAEVVEVRLNPKRTPG